MNGSLLAGIYLLASTKHLQILATHILKTTVSRHDWPLGCGCSPSLCNSNLFFVSHIPVTPMDRIKQWWVGYLTKQMEYKTKTIWVVNSMELNKALKPRTPPKAMTLHQIITFPNNCFIYDLTVTLVPDMSEYNLFCDVFIICTTD